jgi:DNA-directed RNA polymerase subunit RPC12/RpoP
MKCFAPNMSEFKYACPVCGQHIKCDSSQAGTQMQCPTCFQKIIVPQAPTEEQKYILTGTKVGDRPTPKAPDAQATYSIPKTGYSGPIVVFAILAFIAIAAAFVYHGTIFKKPNPQTGAPVTDAPPQKPASKPLPPAPPASDDNWTLNLKGVTIPDSLAAGRIEGQDFIIQHAMFSNGTLTLRYGDSSFAINFSGAKPESLAGKTINVTTNAASAARVSLHWKDGDQSMREMFTNGYAMLLNFSNVVNNHITGTIYLCTSDEKKSYVAGTFKAEIRKPKPKNQ